MQRVLGLTVMALAMTSPAYAGEALKVVYPTDGYTTSAEKIFFIGTAPAEGEVTLNGKPIENRSPSGNFAPSLPLTEGENVFTLKYRDQAITLNITRTVAPVPQLGKFVEGSFIPAADIARQPQEPICFEATAAPGADVSVKLGNRTIALQSQSGTALPPNSAILTNQNQPNSVSGKYQGCTTFSEPGSLGQPLFQLRQQGQTTKQKGPGRVTILSPTEFESIEVLSDQGVARTGPSTDHSRLTPLPKGTQARITGREGEWLRLDYGAWIKAEETQALPPGLRPHGVIRSFRSRVIPNWTEVVFPLTMAVPVSVDQRDRTFTLTLHNATAQTDTNALKEDPIIERLDWSQPEPGKIQYHFQFKNKQQWGYKLRYEGSNLVLSLRHPPVLSQPRIAPSTLEKTPQEAIKQGLLPEGSLVYGNNRITGLVIPQKLSGIKILLDPGHGGAESGSVGPTGVPEKAVNLQVSKLLRQELQKRGATVIMTREEDVDVSLGDRVQMIQTQDPNIALSIHYNALPDNGDALNTAGIGTFWYNAQAHDLSQFLHDYLATELKRPKYGVFWNNLALTRPTAAPSVLLELGFMTNPTEFEWVSDSQAQRQLASTLADGITAWLLTQTAPQ
ncbi:MAG: N-acetylmuramoyl-L-alanine amidase [Thermosynechococcaceae cyanobacterium]